MEKIENVTYRGVYINIEESKICSLRYGLYFYFCSEPMKKHFEEHLPNEIERRKIRLKKVLQNINFIDNEIDMIITVNYYKELEKRGFRIESLSGEKIKIGHLRGDIEFLDS